MGFIWWCYYEVAAHLQVETLGNLRPSPVPFLSSHKLSSTLSSTLKNRSLFCPFLLLEATPEFPISHLKKKKSLTLVQARSLFSFFIEPASLFSFNTSFLSFIACCQNTNRKQTVTLINPHLARLHTQNVSPSPCRKISTALCSLDFFPVPVSLGSPGTRI